MQVSDGRPSHEAAVVTFTVNHAEVEVGIEVQCLNSFVKSNVPLDSQSVLLQVLRMEGPRMCIGALAAMAAYPYLLLQAAELRQARPFLASHTSQPIVPCLHVSVSLVTSSSQVTAACIILVCKHKSCGDCVTRQ